MIDDLTLVVGGAQYTGWTEVRVTRRLEGCPNDFEIGLTEMNPAEAAAITVQPGDPCQIYLGQELAITGYIDVLRLSLNARGHSVWVSGRGKCQDLVDCSAEWPGDLISNNTVLGIATKLAQPYGIDVVQANSPTIGAVIPSFPLNKGEIAWNLIERVCRYRAILPYEDELGRLVLSAVGTNSAASGFADGIKQPSNIQAVSATYSMRERFSSYQTYLMSITPLQEKGDTGNLFFEVDDKTMPRHRMHALVAEASGATVDLGIAKLRAVWEFARRLGQSNQVNITADSWRDASGALWRPNTIVPLSLPSMKLRGGYQWLIGEVSYTRGARGTAAEVIVKPQLAFMPEPVPFLPLPLDVSQALSQGKQ